jgi:phosphoglucosamine mutase
MEKFFGTDGIRGTVNTEKMNSEIALAVGRAVAYFVKNSEELPKIVIGKDTRLSCYMLEEAIASGITSMGINVIKTGPLPTPGVSFICRSMRARLGIMISASHNPAIQNGIKIFSYDGFKLPKNIEEKIELIIKDKIAEKNLAAPDKVGRTHQVHDASGRYIQYLKETFRHNFNLKGMRIAIDGANGAAYKVAPLVFSELGAEIVSIGTTPNGLNINDSCGSMYPEAVSKLVKEKKSNVGVSFDGDADRLILCDEMGNIVDGDGILYVCAKHLNAKGSLGKSTVVGTILSNHGLEVALKKEGISLARTDVGDQQVVEYMKKNGMNLGGEPCGHIMYLHHSTTGDGILSALRVLSIMQQTKKSLSELLNDYKPFPQKTINVPVNEKTDFDQINEIIDVKKRIENELKDNGRVILRYSGTENLARVTVESNEKDLTEKYCTELSEVVDAKLGVKA